MAEKHQSSHRINLPSWCCLIGAFTVFLLQIPNSKTIHAECGLVTEGRIPLIHNGNTVRRGGWPFMAAIFEKPKEFMCGGTILTRKHVLTAAHCVELKVSLRKYSEDEIEVRLGAHNLTADSEIGVENRNVSRIYVNPEWVEALQDPDSFDADIAILVLSVDVTFTVFIQPICLPTDDDVTIDDVKGYIVGYGYEPSEPNHHILREGVTLALNGSYCFQKATGLASRSSSRTFCAGDGVSVPNYGDSGGGFFVVSQSRWVQLGTISAVEANETGHVSTEAFAILNNVKLFKDWITGITEWQSFGCKFENVENMYRCHIIYVLTEYDPSHTKVDSIQQGVDIDNVESIFVLVSNFLQGSRIGETFRNLKRLEIVEQLEYMPSKLPSSYFKDMKRLVELRLTFRVPKFVVDFMKDLRNLENFSLISNGHTELGDTTFSKNFNIKNVRIESNLASISPNLFKNNSLLEDVEFILKDEGSLYLNDGYFPWNLFQNNILLKNVSLTSTYHVIDERIFETNEKLSYVKIESIPLRGIPWNLFRNNFLLERVHIHSLSLISIDGRTFENNGKLRDIELELTKLENFPWNLFKNNLLLDKVRLHFENELETGIDERSFETNEKMREVHLTLIYVEHFPGNLFKNNSLLEKVYFRSNMSSIINETTFEANGNLKNVALEMRQLEHLPSNLFKNNFLLEELFLRIFVSEIDGRTFETNGKLRRIDLKSKRLEYLPWNLFKNNVLLEELHLDLVAIREIDGRTFETNVRLKEFHLSSTKVINPNHRKKLSLPRNLLKRNLLLEYVSISSRVQTIDEDFFETNVNLKFLDLRKNELEFLPKNLFKNNLLLAIINISENNLKIIEVDFSALKDVQVIDLGGNICSDSWFNIARSTQDHDLIEFQHTITSQCTAVLGLNEVSRGNHKFYGSACIARFKTFLVILSFLLYHANMF